jgi:hypothetical protein
VRGALLAAAPAGAQPDPNQLLDELVGGVRPAQSSPEEFFDPGNFTFEVPADVCEVTVNAAGAEGGAGTPGGQQGGEGGEAQATIPTTPGETLAIVVGSQGEDANGNSGGGPSDFGGGGGGGNGGGAGHAGGGGGGASSVVGSLAQVIGGGGGGGAGSSLEEANPTTGDAGGGQAGPRVKVETVPIPPVIPLTAAAAVAAAASSAAAAVARRKAAPAAVVAAVQTSLPTEPAWATVRTAATGTSSWSGSSIPVARPCLPVRVQNRVRAQRCPRLSRHRRQQ